MAFNEKDPKYLERLRYWRLSKGAHKLKNRSSKHLRWINCKNIYRCLSGAVLDELVKNDNFDAYQEVIRRNKRRAKRNPAV